MKAVRGWLTLLREEGGLLPGKGETSGGTFVKLGASVTGAKGFPPRRDGRTGHPVSAPETFIYAISRRTAKPLS